MVSVAITAAVDHTDGEPCPHGEGLPVSLPPAAVQLSILQSGLQVLRERVYLRTRFAQPVVLTRSVPNNFVYLSVDPDRRNGRPIIPPPWYGTSRLRIADVWFVTWSHFPTDSGGMWRRSNESRRHESEQHVGVTGHLVDRHGGRHHGYFLPSEGASDRALALFTFESFAEYEAFRQLFGVDPEFIAADRIRDDSGCILRYERTFMRPLLPP